MPVNFKTAWAVRTGAGEPSASIRVDNIHATITGPHDAWGRANKPQPISVSVEIHMPNSFNMSSGSDAVQSDTVHYGLLTKAVLNYLNTPRSDQDFGSLASVTDLIWRRLSGFASSGHFGGDIEGKPFLEACAFRYLNVEVCLPKASLLGTEVSLAVSVCMSADNRIVPKAWARTLRIHDLRVPVLIGVNENEREAKQILIASVEIDKWNGWDDQYTILEGVIVKTMEDSSFETLESLLQAIAVKITQNLEASYPDLVQDGWKLKIGLRKPIAITFADAPRVELSVDTREIRDKKI